MRRFPARTQDWWREKLARNKERDEETNRRLAEDGWFVIRVWEHEAPEDAADRVAKVLELRKPTY